jgi:hypothetical protein
MAYEITYRKNDETITWTLEWITPENWSATAIRRAFYEQFPQAEIISIEALP